MVMQRGKSAFAAKLGGKLANAFEAHKNDETEFSIGGELPPLENGIAQLVECKFDRVKEGKDNAGEYYFYAAGVVVSPTEVKDFGKVEGLRTSIVEPLYDTPQRQSRKTVDEHIAWMMNELRKLGIDTSSMSHDDLEPTVAALKEAKPYFRFRTWKGQPSAQYPEPRVNHVWGGITDWTPPEDSSGVDDQTGEVQEEVPPSKTNKPTTATKPPATAKPAATTSKPPVTKTTKATPGAYTDDGDLESLVERANGQDEAAQGELAQLAEKAGWTEEQVGDASSWEEVREMIESGGPPTGDDGGETTEDEPPQTEEEPEPEAAVPEKGDVYHFTPIDAKTRKPGKKTFVCEVTNVDSKKKTVQLKNLDDAKTVYKDVSWDALIAK